MARRRRGLPVNGVLLLDKPKGISSNHALQRVRRLFEAQKAGHTGTLDPMATGLLPICLGEATKFSAHLLEADKMYRTRVELGVITDTGDAEGQLGHKDKVYPQVNDGTHDLRFHLLLGVACRGEELALDVVLTYEEDAWCHTNDVDPRVLHYFCIHFET